MLVGLGFGVGGWSLVSTESRKGLMWQNFAGRGVCTGWRADTSGEDLRQGPVVLGLAIPD